VRSALRSRSGGGALRAPAGGGLRPLLGRLAPLGVPWGGSLTLACWGGLRPLLETNP